MAEQKKTEQKAAKKTAPRKPAPVAQYEVTCNGGNAPGGTVVNLKELGAIAKRQLVDEKAGQVTLTVKPLLQPGQYGAERVDGVK